MDPTDLRMGVSLDLELTDHMDAVESGGHEPGKGASHLPLDCSGTADTQVPGVTAS